MTTSVTTFEYDFRQRLLDIVYSQWHDLGVPFSEVRPSSEVIDPEALIWCSLEFLPKEPRLCEAVVDWLRTHGDYIIRQRVRARANSKDWRGSIWRILDGLAPTTDTLPASRPKHAPIPKIDRSPSLNSMGARSLLVGILDVEPHELSIFSENLQKKIARQPSTPSRIGDPVHERSTLLLRARDLLGSDSRHFLLIYLLANPGGARLRDVQQWTGYSYRTTSQIAVKWANAGVAVIDHGYCRLTDYEPWQTLLQLRQGTELICLVDFFQLFEASIALLRGLAKARDKNLDQNGPVVTSLRRKTREAIAKSQISDIRNTGPSAIYLGELFSNIESMLHDSDAT